MSLNIIALISGGKDSFFSLIHCLANSHKVIALANLHPGHGQDEDLDSHMYQTVGHDLIFQYESVLRIPLYRQEITGSAHNRNKTYEHNGEETGSEDATDETESLLPLLRRIKQAHPNANAISSGAILSDYQRTRIENVAFRLDLIPLAYLWQYPSLFPADHTALLKHMNAVGIDARIIKVASGGLDESYLWKNAADPSVIPALDRAINRYGDAGPGAVLGEGGEFETLVIDGPSDLFRKRLNADASDATVIQAGGGAAFLSFGRFHERSDTMNTKARACITEKHVGDIIKPDELDNASKSLLSQSMESLTDDDTIRSSTDEDQTNATDTRALSRAMDQIVRSSSVEASPTYACLNMSAPDGVSLREQLGTIFRELGDYLQKRGLDAANVVLSTLLLRDISYFSSANAVYGDFFQAPNPPARVTVSCGDCLPSGTDILMSVIIDGRPASARNTLHVQSRSYWAPANIGPYSQAVSLPFETSELSFKSDHGSLVYISGQIPLSSASMEIRSNSTSTNLQNFWQQTVLSLQHVERVSQCMQTSQYLSAVAFLSDTGTLIKRIQFCRSAWESRMRISLATPEHEEEEMDPWDRKNLSSRLGSPNSTWLQDPPTTKLATYTDRTKNRGSNISLLVAVVDKLPRDASIEWVVLGMSNASIHSHESQEFEGEESQRSVSKIATNVLEISTHSFPWDVWKEAAKGEAFLKRLRELADAKDRSYPISAHRKRRFCLINAYVDTRTLDLGGISNVAKIQVVPCKSVWAPNGTRLAAGIIRRLEYAVDA